MEYSDICEMANNLIFFLENCSKHKQNGRDRSV